MAILTSNPLRPVLLSVSTLMAILLAYSPSIAQPQPLLQTVTVPLTTAVTSSSTVSAHSKQTLVEAVSTVGITVSDMDEAVAFYTQVLPFQVVSDFEIMGSEYEHLEGVFGARIRVVSLRLGNEMIELRDYLTPEGDPIPLDSRSNDLWFQHIAIVVSNMEDAFNWLRQHQVQFVSTGPQRLPDYLPAAAGIEAFYFRDPDGHNLEIIYFPPDKGDPRWQNPSTQLFLGIDHTAIAVADTETSLHFYRDLLGLDVAGASENYGTEQEHLNNVFGARLQITGLRASTGPGIEFLDYLAPAGGRPFPTDTQANDLLQWQTTLVVNNIDAVAQKLQSAGYSLISNGVITLPNDQLGFSHAFLVRDPDGHVLRIVEGRTSTSVKSNLSGEQQGWQ